MITKEGSLRKYLIEMERNRRYGTMEEDSKKIEQEIKDLISLVMDNCGWIEEISIVAGNKSKNRISFTKEDNSITENQVIKLMCETIKRYEIINKLGVFQNERTEKDKTYIG